jgi:pimeloyl-ACP methyl ester carboxylesterase
MLTATALLAALYSSGNHLYSLTKTDSDALFLLDYDSGKFSRLRASGDEYVSGPSIGVDEPIVLRVRIASDAITMNRSTAQRIDPFTTEDVKVRSGDITLAGTLYLPRTPGRHPAIVAAPGGGNATRRTMALPAPYFARRGIAVLALDKRGNGESSGDWKTATYADLASDVVRAIEVLQQRADIDPKCVGVYASSQGGWIAPIAAASSPRVAFVVCAACPATTMPEQELIRTEAELRADGLNADEIRSARQYRFLLFDYLRTGHHHAELEAADQQDKSARWYPRFGGVVARDAPTAAWWRLNDAFDPVDSWRRVHVPSLVLFGERDTRIPPATHARLIAAADPRAKIVIVPGIDHEGFMARTGGRDEVPSLDRIPPRAFEPTIDWILAQR